MFFFMLIAGDSKTSVHVCTKLYMYVKLTLIRGIIIRIVKLH